MYTHTYTKEEMLFKYQKCPYLRNVEVLFSQGHGSPGVLQGILWVQVPIIGNQAGLHALHQCRQSLAIVPTGSEVLDAGVRYDGLNPGKEGALGSTAAAFLLGLSTYAKMIMEDQFPYQAEDELLVVVHDIGCTYSSNITHMLYGNSGNFQHSKIFAGCLCAKNYT